MSRALPLLALLLAAVAATGRLEVFKTAEDYLNVCLDGQSHKDRPGPETDMYNLCTPYKSWSCCTAETSSKLLTNSTWYNFSSDHCGRLSDKCRRHFQRDLCFYECSPNLGPWLVPDNRKWRKERFMNVPLCRSDCNDWFYDCKDDLTCVPNWSKDFVWTSGRQTCPMDASGQPAQCRRFQDVYGGGAQEFCETVWDHSFKVVDDSQPCMRLNFEDSDVTNNAAVAEQRAHELVEGARHSLTNAAPTVGDLRLTFTCLMILVAGFMA
jgi:folate receptor